MVTGSLALTPLAETVTWHGSEIGGGVNAPPLEICPAVADQWRVGRFEAAIWLWNWSYPLAENCTAPLPTVTEADVPGVSVKERGRA